MTELKQQNPAFFGAALQSGMIPQTLRPKDIQNPTEAESTALFTYLEPFVYNKGNQWEVSVVQTTATARAFTHSFFLSFLSTLALSLWLLGRGLTLAAFVSAIAVVAVELYLWKDSRILGKIYYEKILRIAFTHSN